MTESSVETGESPVNRPASKGILTSLKLSRQFRFLWVSNLFFFGGAWTQTLVLAWLVLEMTGSTFHLALFTAVLLSAGAAQSQGTIQIAQLEPLSGPFQTQGEGNARTLQAAVDEFNARGKGVKFEVTAFDAKGSPQEALNIFRQATERGIRYIAGGGTSAIVSGLIEAVNTHNERNPGKEVLYLNHQAIDPDFTESRCSFWHFRFDPHVHMRMFALTGHIARDTAVKKVYLINQDYSFGHQVEISAKRYLTAARSDIAVVGEERHPPRRLGDDPALDQAEFPDGSGPCDPHPRPGLVRAACPGPRLVHPEGGGLVAARPVEARCGGDASFPRGAWRGAETLRPERSRAASCLTAPRSPSAPRRPRGETKCTTSRYSFSSNPNASTVSATPTSTSPGGTAPCSAISQRITQLGTR